MKQNDRDTISKNDKNQSFHFVHKRRIKVVDSLGVSSIRSDRIVYSTGVK